MKKALLATLHLFSVFSFFATALIFMALSIVPEMRLQAACWISSPESCQICGIGLLGIAIVLFVGFYKSQPGRFLELQAGKGLTSIHHKAIRKTLEECFQRNFPEKIFLSGLDVIRGKNLEIQVLLAPLDEGLREELFIEAQSALAPLLKERFGYTKPFSLLVRCLKNSSDNFGLRTAVINDRNV